MPVATLNDKRLKIIFMPVTNFDSIRIILKDISEDEAGEIEEYLDTIESDFNTLKDKKEELDSDVERLESALEDAARDSEDYENHNVGLDTIVIKLENENLLIRNRVDEFIDQLKKEFLLPS